MIILLGSLVKQLNVKWLLLVHNLSHIVYVHLCSVECFFNMVLQVKLHQKCTATSRLAKCLKQPYRIAWLNSE